MALGDRYLDAIGGNNSNNGLTWATAWKTFHKLSSVNWDSYDADEIVRIYLKPGYYWLDESFSIGVRTNCQLEFIGIGQVVFVNPGRKKLTLNGASANVQSTYVRIINISFDTDIYERPIICNLTGSPNTWLFNFGWMFLYFLNCSFKERIFWSTSGNCFQIFADRCGCMAGKTLTNTPSAISSLPLNHVLHDYFKVVPDWSYWCIVTCTNSFENMTRKTSGIMETPLDSLGIGPYPSPFVAKNAGSAFIPLTRDDIMKLRLNSTDWVDDTSFTDGRTRVGVGLGGLSEITIQSGVAARVLSPVYQYVVPSIFNRAQLITKEVDVGPNHGAFIDSTVGDAGRTVEFRTSMTPFNPGDTAIPWVVYTRDTNTIGNLTNYIQLRITLETRAS